VFNKFQKKKFLSNKERKDFYLIIDDCAETEEKPELVGVSGIKYSYAMKEKMLRTDLTAVTYGGKIPCLEYFSKKVPKMSFLFKHNFRIFRYPIVALLFYTSQGVVVFLFNLSLFGSQNVAYFYNGGYPRPREHDHQEYLVQVHTLSPWRKVLVPENFVATDHSYAAIELYDLNKGKIFELSILGLAFRVFLPPGKKHDYYFARLLAFIKRRSGYTIYPVHLYTHPTEKFDALQVFHTYSEDYCDVYSQYRDFCEAIGEPFSAGKFFSLYHYTKLQKPSYLVNKKKNIHHSKLPCSGCARTNFKLRSFFSHEVPEILLSKVKITKRAYGVQLCKAKTISDLKRFVMMFEVKKYCNCNPYRVFPGHCHGCVNFVGDYNMFVLRSIVSPRPLFSDAGKIALFFKEKYGGVLSPSIMLSIYHQNPVYRMMLEIPFRYRGQEYFDFSCSLEFASKFYAIILRIVETFDGASLDRRVPSPLGDFYFTNISTTSAPFSEAGETMTRNDINV
jgi:hypothetical protein